MYSTGQWRVGPKKPGIICRWNDLEKNYVDDIDIYISFKDENTIDENTIDKLLVDKNVKNDNVIVKKASRSFLNI